MSRLLCYTNVIENIEYLKGAGLLTDSQIEEIKKWTSKDSFVPALLQDSDGASVQGWKLHKYTKTLWTDESLKYPNQYIYDTVLSSLLSEEEIEKINKYANDIWRKAREKDRFDKAEKIESKDWKGWVYYEGYNDGYFESVGDLLDYAGEIESPEDDDSERPKYVWATKQKPCCSLDFDGIMESGCQESFEGFDYSYLEGLDDLKKAIDIFNDLNKDVVSYYPDYSKAILV